MEKENENGRIYVKELNALAYFESIATLVGLLGGHMSCPYILLLL